MAADTPSGPGPSLGEFGRIERFFRPLAAACSGALDLTDDAATLAVPAGRELVVTTDAIVAGIHFLPSDSPGDVAHKALRVNLSDLAAKGAEPLAYTLTLALDRSVEDGWVAAFAEALAEDQAEFGIALLGGDSVSTGGPNWVSITAFGLVEAGRMVRRSGARRGDALLVTGTIGDAALGLLIAKDDLALGPDESAYLAGRYRVPQPRTALARAVAVHASAALDISDGLAADLGHLCQVSGVSGIVEIGRIPLSVPALRAVQIDPALWQSVLAGGDDYEILMAVPPDRLAGLEAAAATASVPLARIGRIEAGPGRAVLLGPDGREISLARTGWTHR